MNIGTVTLGFRDYRTAEGAFRRVLGLDPESRVKFDATVGLGVALRGQRRFAEAMAQYEAAEKIRSEFSGNVAYNKGILVQDYFFDAGNPDKGIATLEQARDLFERYQRTGRDKSQVKDARRRLKNIAQMIPILVEQKRAMKQTDRLQGKREKRPEKSTKKNRRKKRRKLRKETGSRTGTKSSKRIKT
jgi:tetratricopeptide (TPR) repeat protein